MKLLLSLFLIGSAAAAKKCRYVGELTGTFQNPVKPKKPNPTVSKCVKAKNPKPKPINGVTRTIPGVDIKTCKFIEAQVQSSTTDKCLRGRVGTNFSNPVALFKGLTFANADKKIYVVECDCPKAASHGDPHIKPWNGDRYYFMGECDSVLHSSSILDIHIRTTIKDFYSVIEATAIRVGESILEMAMGDTHTFWINGVQFTDDDLPLQMEGKYSFSKVGTIHNGAGTLYALELEYMTVQLHVVKFLMGVDLIGSDPSFDKERTGGLTGQYPNGELLSRDNATLFEYDDMVETVQGRVEPVSNSMGREWQVRDTDPQLFREVRDPVWPSQCLFPSEDITASRRRLSTSVDIVAATTVCAELHEEGSHDFDFCVMDVLMTHEEDAAYSW